MGDVVGDLNRRRGIIEGMDDGNAGLKIIRARVPLSEMFGLRNRSTFCDPRPCFLLNGVC
ncbi:hypothetical protein ACT691_04495 [Vibrio metschnikovii]